MAALPVSSWSLGWRTLWRDWRAGELRLLVIAVVLAVAALTAVGFFADRRLRVHDRLAEQVKWQLRVARAQSK